MKEMKKMKNIKKKVLSLALSLALSLSLVPGTGLVLTAYAEGDNSIVSMGGTIHNPTPSAGGWSYVYYGTFDGTPMKYRILDTAATEFNVNTTMLLDCDSLLTSMAHYPSTQSNLWANSQIKSWLNGSSFYGNTNVFTVQEKAAIVSSTKASAATEDGAGFKKLSYAPLTGEYIFLLDAKEATRHSYGYKDYSAANSYRIKSGTFKSWWLRSPYATGTESAGCVDNTTTGSITSGTVTQATRGVSPAFNLNPSSILLTSAATGGKTSGDIGASALQPVPDNTSDEWKLTLKDDGSTGSVGNSHAGFTASREDSGNVVAGDAISITYSGAQTGDNEYVSVFLKDSDEKILYYGHLAEKSESATAAALTIPADIESGVYTVGVFAEQCNGDKKTDYASAISEFPITVVTHTHEFTYAAGTGEDADTITATCANTDGKCPLTDCKATLTIAANGGTYDGTTSFGATITDENSIQGEAKVKYQKKTGESSYGTETETAPTDAGTYKASITLGGATAFVEYTIAKADISPVVNIENWDYGQIAKTPSVTDESNPGGGEVTYKYYTDEECTKETTSDQGATEDGGVPEYGGDYWVKATVAETDNYNSGTATKKFTINATAVKVKGLKYDSKVYDGTTEAVLNTSEAKLEGVPATEDVQIASATGKFSDKNVGEGKTISDIVIVLSGSKAGGYKATADPETLTGAITAKPVTVSGITASDKTYDGNTTAALTFTGATFAGMIDGDNLSVKGKTAQDGTFNDKNVGTDKPVTLPELELGGADAGNYTIKTDSQTTTTAAITAKEVSVTAEDKSKTYGDTDPELTYTADGLITGDTFTGALTRAEGEDAGTYDINQGTLSAGNNYTIKYTKGTFTINKATTNSVTATIEGWTYGDNPNNPSATATYGQDKATFAYSDAADGTYTETVPTDAGTWYVKATVAETDNYAGAVSDSVAFTIAKKEVGLEWSNTELTYNGNAQKPKATAKGLVDEDECDVTVTGEKTDANAKSGEDSYTATAISLSNVNYKLPDNTTTEFTIVPKKLTQAMISLDSDTFKHDGTEKSPQVTMTDKDILVEEAPKKMVEGEDYTLSGDVRSSELGTHVITAEGKGNYTGTIDTSWMMYNNKSSEEKEEGTEGGGDFEVFVDVENNSSDLAVDNLTVSMAKGFLTEEDMVRYNSGESVLVYMIFKEQPESEVESTDSSLLGGLFRTEGTTDISWYDITVWKKIGNSAAVQVHDTIDELSMGVEVPDKYKNAPEGYTREFYLGRAHDGIASILANTSKVKVGFSSSKFSTYALAYKDTKIPKPDSDKPDDSDTGDNGNGSSSSKGGAKTRDNGNGSSSSNGGAKTGDPIDIAGLLALMLASGGALVAIGYRRRREMDK